jgi:hypothetical protein
MSGVEVRKVYRPVQPAVNFVDGLINYSELLPHPGLSNYIYYYWRLHSTTELSIPFSYRVIPDGCIDIFINLKNVNESRVMGFSTTNVVFDLDKSFDYLGIRFLPAAFPLMFKIDASALKDRDEDLFGVLPSLAKHLTTKLEGVFNFSMLKTLLDNSFLKLLENQKIKQDKRLHNAIYLVLQSHGNVSFKSDIDTGISQRQLRRLFEYYIGDTPKIFSKVVRFQYLFQLLSRDKKYSFNKVFLDCGYYDQPHFNKDFKAFFGLTPGEVISR